MHQRIKVSCYVDELLRAIEVQEVQNLLKAPLQGRMRASTGLTDTVSDADNFDYLADGFKALADTTRLQIIHLLMTCGEMCVCEFMPALGLTQSNISFHLKTLKYAGFITSRKEGKWMFYALNRKDLEQFRTDFGNAFDLGRWPEKTESISCKSTSCKQMKCR